MAPTPALFDGIGFTEILMVGFVAILVYGGRLPEVMRSFGQAYARFRRGVSEASQPLREEIQRATTLPAEVTTPMADLEPHAHAVQGEPHVAPHAQDGHGPAAAVDVPSVPYEPSSPCSPEGTPASGAGAPTTPADASAPAPAPAAASTPAPWPSAAAPAQARPARPPDAPPAAPSGLDEPPPV